MWNFKMDKTPMAIGMSLYPLKQSSYISLFVIGLVSSYLFFLSIFIVVIYSMDSHLLFIIYRIRPSQAINFFIGSSHTCATTLVRETSLRYKEMDWWKIKTQSTTGDIFHMLFPEPFAVWLMELPMFPFLVFCHILHVTLKLDRLPGFSHQYWLKTLVVTFCVAFGGSTIAHILCGKVVVWLSFPNDRLMVTTFLAWWLVHCLPWFPLIARWSWIRATVAGFAAVAKARSTMQFVDDVHKWFPIGGGIIGNVVLGTIAGCGGNIFLVAEEKWRVGSSFVSELSYPTSNLRSAFYISLVYAIARRKRWQYSNYLSLQWEQWLPISSVYKYICLLMFVHSWLEEYTGSIHLLDWLLAPWEQVARFLFRMKDCRVTNGGTSNVVHDKVTVKTTSALAYVKQHSPMKKVDKGL